MTALIPADATIEQIKRGAADMLENLVDADLEAVKAQMMPSAQDYERVFLPEAVATAREGYMAVWATMSAPLNKPGQTSVLTAAATATSLLTDNEMSRAFPGGYRRVAEKLIGDRVWVRFKLVNPGASSGMAYDGLVWLGDHWAWFPKPWRVLGDD